MSSIRPELCGVSHPHPRPLPVGRGGRLLAVVTALALHPVTRADTLAYWRFEDQPVGQKLDATTGTNDAPYSTSKSSATGLGPLRTFNTRPDRYPPDTSPTFVAPSDLPKLAGGIANARCARFVGSQDLYTTPAPVAAIDAARLDAFTVEGLFRLDALSTRIDDKFQTIVGKDGKPVDRLPFQPFVAVVAGHDNDHVTRDCLTVNIVDRGGNYVSAASKVKLVADQWYAFAAVADGRTLKLFLNRFDGRGYQLEGEAPTSGGLIESTGTWTVGRGMFDRAPNSWLYGCADEVRISDRALQPTQFLAHGIDRAPPAAPTPVNAARPLKCVDGVADPVVLFHDGVYHLYGTGNMNGFDVHTSRDLKQWTKGPRVIERGPGVWGDDNFWAPGIVERNGKFYFYYSTVGVLPIPGGPRTARLNVAVADRPTGPFREVVARMPLLGRAVIDAQPFIDADGTPYLYFVGDVSEGRGQVYVARLAEDMLSIQGEPVKCIEPSQPWEGTTWNEGPFVFRDGDTYVMTYSGEFWASPEYAVGYATAPTPWGPWDKADDNPILHRYAGLRGTGHNAILRAPDGKGWLTFFHAHRDGPEHRDTYVARLVVGRDLRGKVTLGVEPLEPSK